MKLALISIILLISLKGVSQSTEDQLNILLDSIYEENPEAIGMLVSVQSDKLGLSWIGAVGYSSKSKVNELLPNQPVLIASNTKTYVAAAILKLVDKKMLGLSDPIKSVITRKSDSILSSVGYVTQSITVSHLLSHSAGINDYVDSTYFSFVAEHPGHKWTRDEQIRLAAGKGLPKAIAGEQFSYGDINYLLLTEIIESKTGESFYKSIRDLLDFETHGLNKTWFMQLEDNRLGMPPMAHQYWMENNWDSHEIDPSWDLYGGGGLASTIEDLSAFFQKFFTNQIITDSTLLNNMVNPINPGESNYGFGIRKISFGDLIGYYHGGFWGTDAMYLPKYDMSISVATLNKDKRDLNATISHKIIDIIRNAVND